MPDANVTPNSFSGILKLRDNSTNFEFVQKVLEFEEFKEEKFENVVQRIQSNFRTVA